MNDSLPLLSLCLVWPLLGAVSIAVLSNRDLAKRWALAVAGIELLLTLLVAFYFDPEDSSWQLQETYRWLPSLNIQYQLAVDGISVWFLPLTALLTLMTMQASWQNVQSLTRLHLALILLLESVTIGVFTATDLVLFFLFWELTLPPIFLLIGLWGIGAERRQAANKYTLFMLFGGAPLLFAIILLAQNYAQQHGGVWSFSLPELLATPIDLALQQLVFALLLLGFAVKAPLLPFHTWLPTVAMQAPTHLTALLVGLKLGIYGIIRFALPLAPQAAFEYRWLLAIIGAITLVYAALIALRQTNLRRLLAYASISHVGMVVMAIAAFNQQALQGAVMQLLNFGLIASSLMLLAGMIEQRLGSNELVHLGGLAKPLPRLTTLFFLFALASIGVPGSNGFVAELLMLLGVVEGLPVLSFVALFAAVLGAGYLLNYIRQGFWGPVVQVDVQRSQDLLPRELLLLIVPALLVLLLGLMPQGLLANQSLAVIGWLQRVEQPQWLLVKN